MTHKLYIGDATKILEKLEEPVHLVIASPPWRFEKEGIARTPKEFGELLSPVLLECKRLLVDGGYMVLETGDCYKDKQRISYHHESYALTKLAGFLYKGMIVQYSPSERVRQTFPGTFPYPPNIPLPRYEYFLVTQKPGRQVISEEIKRASKLTKEDWKAYTEPTWQYSGIVGKSLVMVEEFCRRLIRFYSFVGNTVLDPFVGTGTTIRAAAEEGRNSISIELEEDIALQAAAVIKRKWELDVYQRGAPTLHRTD